MVSGLNGAVDGEARVQAVRTPPPQDALPLEADEDGTLTHLGIRDEDGCDLRVESIFNDMPPPPRIQAEKSALRLGLWNSSGCSKAPAVASSLFR